MRYEAVGRSSTLLSCLTKWEALHCGSSGSTVGTLGSKRRDTVFPSSVTTQLSSIAAYVANVLE